MFSIWSGAKKVATGIEDLEELLRVVVDTELKF